MDEHVDVTHECMRLTRDARRTVAIADIGRNGMGATARGGDLVHERLEWRWMASNADDGEAVAGKPEGEGATESARSSGDECGRHALSPSTATLCLLDILSSDWIIH
jgi:hypothetical protein